MKENKGLGLFLLFISVFIIGLVTIGDYLKRITPDLPLNEGDNTISSINPVKEDLAYIKINDSYITAEIAETPQQRETGLSYRDNLDEKSGMLFVFASYQKPFFWMKDMLFPLDIIWIKDDKIIDIDKNLAIPQPEEPLNRLPKYAPSESVNYVLEVNAGFSDTNALSVGDSVSINFN